MSVEPSDLFEDVFLGSGGGTPVSMCWCGRVAYSDSPYYDPGEREGLEQRAAESPEQYVFFGDCDSISIVEIFGMTFVRGCPCNALARLERFIWTYRKSIARYLKRRAEAVAKEAQDVLGDLDGD